ncbi:IS3 family transposase [Streptomyces atratus]|uniref:IS3 family transposase n=1 Tax=Streptomyces TaxID=1883 RepID=UPI00378B7FE3
MASPTRSTPRRRPGSRRESPTYRRPAWTDRPATRSSSPTIAACSGFGCRSATRDSTGTTRSPSRSSPLSSASCSALLPGPWPVRAAARTAISEYIESRFNLRRLHSSLGHRSPAEYETALSA